MRVSFIIPHKGRTELLERTIQSILALEFDLKTVEVLVVTQNESLELQSLDLTKISLKTIFRPAHETISTLRNIGAKEAAGEYFVFLDADIQLAPNWLKVMFQEMESRSERVLISAVQRCEASAVKLHQIRTVLNAAASDNTVEFLDGRNLFLKRQTFEQVGGFPEHLVTCEDYFFTNNVAQHGELYVTSTTSYIHLGEDRNYSEMFRKEIWRGQSNLQSLKGRKIPLREVPSILTPIWEALWFLITIILLVLGKPLLAILSFGLFCLPILLYTSRLTRIGRDRFGVADALGFYCVYFPARTIGTMLGMFKVIKS